MTDIVAGSQNRLVSPEPERSPSHVIAVIAVIAVLGAIGIATKAPFGHQLMHVAGHDVSPNGSGSWNQLLFATEWGQLVLTVIGGLLFYRYAGFHAAPLFERKLFGEHAAPKTRIVRPAVVTTLILTTVSALVLFGSHGPPIATDLVSGKVPHDEAIKLAWLWPLGFLGAGLSEEVLCRFGVMIPIMGVIGFFAGRRPRVVLATFWLANIVQAFLFGYSHVTQGVLASNTGGLFISTLLAPQTWVGLVLGWLFVRRGIESAILTHMLFDFLVPAVVIIRAYMAL